MPSLQKYKKRDAARIPSVGTGRGQRYPPAALDLFLELRDEGLRRRGRRTSARAARDGRQDGLLSLQEIQKRTGISYQTLLRYTKRHLGRLPHVGSGRSRRYPSHAVEAFLAIRGETKRGRKRTRRPITPPSAGNDLRGKLDRLEAAQRALAKELRELEQLLKRPAVFAISR